MSLSVIVIRAIYFAAALQLFGLLSFGLIFAPARQRRWAFGLTALILLAMFGLLAAEATMMSGEAISTAIVGTVLRETRFGEWWIVRAVLLVALAAILLWRSHVACIAATVAAGAVLVVTAATGHAGAEGNYFHLAADALHLLAVGAWLGGLVPFALAMTQPRQLADIFCDAMRFSLLGTICVGIILATGGVNAWFLVGNVHALTGTDYGRLLILKLVLFAAMIAVAAINRLRLTPMLRGDAGHAVPALRRNALIEAALGLAIVAIVALLGTMAPAYDVAAGRM